MEKVPLYDIPFTLDKTNLQVISSHQSSLIRYQQLDGQERQCRICLENEHQKALIKACACRGSVGFVHSECLKQWILRKVQKNDINLSCELCREKFKFNKKTFKAFSCSFFLSKLKEETLKLLLIIIIYLTFLCGNIYLSILIKRATDEPQDGELRQKLFIGPQIQMILTTIVVFVFLVLTIIGLAFFGAYFMKKETQLQIEPFEKDQTQQMKNVGGKRKPFNLKIFPVL